MRSHPHSHFHFHSANNQQPNAKQALREDCTLVLDEGALMTWRNGDVTFANGADLVVRGTLETDNNGTTGHFGQAQLIAPSASALADPRLMVPYRILRYLSTSTYYKPGMDIELAPMDYINPLCGGACRDTSQVYIRDKGSVVQRRGSRAIFVVALNFLDESTMAMENNVFTALNSGGELGNKAVVTVGTGSTLSLDGGKLLMRPLSNIKGDGELIVLSGEHEVASVVTAHITISGGTLLWPFTAGDGETITFDGGLRVNNTGKLQINPWSTQIIVKKLVEIWNESQVIFPAIGIADQPSQSDRVDAPDASPRGRFLATERFDLMGGTLQGKTDFVSEKFLFMGGGEKKIRFLAKVINQGLAVWEQGDIISENQGDFLNFGTLELYDSTTFSASAFIEGRVIPLENGGDYFAKRFHSSDMDEGRLNYTEYVLLRTEVVSRAPLGWTEDLQDDDTTRNDL
jgi:hypothetical protein